MRDRPANYVAKVALLAAAYFILGKLGLMLAYVNPSASPVWPPTGLALAALLVLGMHVWPGVLLGAFLVNVTTAGSVATSLCIAGGNTLEGLVGAYLVERFAGGRSAFERPRDVFRFVVLAGMLSPTISATFGVTSLAVAGFASWGAYGAIWLTWWLGDGAGALVNAPLLITWSARPLARWSQGQAREALALLLCALVVGLIVLGGVPAGIGRYPLPFVCLPLLIWAAFRLGPRETVTVSFLLSCIAIWGALRGAGPFMGGTPNESLLLLQAFMAVTTIVAMSLAALVSERRRAQEALVQRAAELARSNAELEQYAYVASHDLREPLRVVTSFVQLLAKRYRGRLDGDADEFIRYIVGGTTRMRQLIDDLLALSRVSRRPKSTGVADAGQALRMALASSRVSIKESGAVISYGEMPCVLCDASQLEQVFENLIGNAIKFRSGERPKIDIGAERRSDGWLFHVRDNGIGVPPECAERIFVIFQRLHGRDKYPGSGIGLAICHKIVTGHGGRIWVESEPGRGSTFYFTLPGTAGRAAVAVHGDSAGKSGEGAWLGDESARAYTRKEP